MQSCNLECHHSQRQLEVHKADLCRVLAYCFGVRGPTAVQTFNCSEQAQDCAPAEQSQADLSQFLLLAKRPSGMEEELAAVSQSREEDAFNDVLKANLLAAYSKAVLLALRLAKGKAKRGGHSSVIAGMLGKPSLLSKLYRTQKLCDMYTKQGRAFADPAS